MSARPAKYPTAAVFVPEDPATPLPQLQAAAQACRGCDLYRNATQVVFGERLSDALAGRDEPRKPAGRGFMLVGEQPGDQEDIQGRPFVGPAGQLLDKALAEAGIDRAAAYVTNAVKHFRWAPAPRGKRRLHRRPDTAQVLACRPWLEREIAVVRPIVIVCLGATAARSLLGAAFRVTAFRGRVAPVVPELRPVVGGARCMATVHPSAVLRLPERGDREREYAALVRDLRAASALVHGAAAASAGGPA